VDEIGYLPVSRTGAMLFFQLMARRYETASTVLTSNKGFEEWGEIFGDEVMAAALIDRLLHHCHIVSIRGNSYRMRHHSELYQALQPPGREMGDDQPRRKRSRREAPTHYRHVTPRRVGHSQSPQVGHFRSPLTESAEVQLEVCRYCGLQ